MKDKDIVIACNCNCGFCVDRPYRTNEYGYFEIPASYCPNCFQLLTWDLMQHPQDIEEYYNVGVEDANKR